MTIPASASTWLLVAFALALAASPRSEQPPGQPPEQPPGPASRRPLSRRAVGLLAAAAVLVACIGVLGAGRGALVAVVAAPAGAALVRRLHDRAPPSRPSASLALTLDLVSVALRAGQPLDAALTLSAEPGTTAGDALSRVAGLLRLGADPDEAWRVADDDAVLARVAATARRSATSGARLAGAFERLAAQLREEIRAGASARAQRVGVLAAAPLGLCFLPAFVCLGIVPIIIGIASGVLGL
jgi:Flp pilus assembly protein TadB